ncbi:MAG TPA: hypothetical protein ENJ84_05530 [Gammaproteobacteria bacterium]|nr:hypothetical protein [Gammaproteobacteria bacterium]
MLMGYWFKIKHSSLDISIAISLLFSLVALVGCEGNWPNTADRSSGPTRQSESINSHEWFSKDDLALLKSSNVFDVRMAISNISASQNEDATSNLIDLWNGEGYLFEEVNKKAIINPVVRLTLAQSIIQKGVSNNEYYEYIKKYVYSNDIVVKTIASEALRDVYSEDALYMLRKIADSEDEKIAEIAISGLKHQTIFGENRKIASSIWKELGESNTRYKDIIEKYDQMYDGYLRERERRIKEGFVPAE